MAQKYRKKPVVIEAIQWTGDNKEQMKQFIKNNIYFTGNGELHIFTLEGEMSAAVGDYIIKGINNEYYPCKPDIFEKTYERVVTEN